MKKTYMIRTIYLQEDFIQSQSFFNAVFGEDIL